MNTVSPSIEVRTRPVGTLQMNTYVLVDLATRRSVLLDPGAEPATLRQLLQGTTPEALLLTHTHADHVGALPQMRRELGVPVLAHSGPHSRSTNPHADRWLHEGDTVQVGETTLTARHTPGHSHDMLTFLTGDADTGITAFVGDTIFDGGPGRTRSTRDFQTTLHTLRTIVLSWPDTTICYPGHGPSFRLGARRAAIEAFVATDHGSFSGDATWNMANKS